MTPTMILRGPLADQQAFLTSGPLRDLPRFTFADLVTPSPRDRASVYFTLLARHFMAGTPIILSNTWLDQPPGSLDAARSRMLLRLALGMGAVAVDCGFDVLPPCGLPTLPASDFTVPHAEFLAFPNPGPGAGSFKPGVSLLVGSSPNSAKHGSLKHRLPFFSLHDGGCSGWLTNHLEAAGVPEERLYWINAYDHASVPTGAEFLQDLRPAKVALLGTDAGKWWKYYAHPHVVGQTLVQGFDHPMYHKRFTGQNEYGLGAFLRGPT